MRSRRGQVKRRGETKNNGVSEREHRTGRPYETLEDFENAGGVSSFFVRALTYKRNDINERADVLNISDTCTEEIDENN